MKFINLIIGLSAAVIVRVNAIGDCDSGPFAQLLPVGDKHDASDADVDICETQWTYGTAVKGIEVWGSSKRISGILLTYTNDDHSHLMGAREGDKHESLQWDPFTQYVTRAVLWSDKNANQLGGLRIELNDGKSLEMKINDISKVTLSPDVGSGILLGMFGRSDDHVTALGWMFLEDKVDKIQIGDFKWDEDLDQFVATQKGMKRNVVASTGIYNTASNASTIGFDSQYSITNSYSYAQSVHWTFGGGYSLEISGQVAGVGPKSTVHVDIEVGQETRNEWTESSTTSLTFKLLQPAVSGKTTQCIGFVEYGEVDMGYEANVHMTLKNGKTFDFRERGERKQTFWGREQVYCADEDGDHSSESPQDFVDRHRQQGDAQEVQKPQQRFIKREWNA